MQLFATKLKTKKVCKQWDAQKIEMLNSLDYIIFQCVILYTKVTSVLTSRLKRSQNDWTDQFRAWDSLYCNHLPNKLPLKAKEWEAKKRYTSIYPITHDGYTQENFVSI